MMNGVAEREIISSPGIVGSGRRYLSAAAIDYVWLLHFWTPFSFQSKELCILAVFVQTEEKKTKGVTATAINCQMGAYGEDRATLFLELCSKNMRESRSLRRGNYNYL